MKLPEAKTSVMRLLKIAWAQIILVLAAGFFLTFLPARGWTEPLHHIGIGLLVAAVVTGFWHLREFSEFFEQFSTAVLIKNEYLSKLSFRSLADLRSKAARAILESCVDNPNYRHHELGDWIDSMLFEDLLPGRESLSGIYRQGYKEDVSLEFLTLREGLEEIAGTTSGIPNEELQARILKVTSIARFTAISPRLNSPYYPAYKTGYGGRAADLPHFPLEHRIKLDVGHTEKSAGPVKIDVTNEPMGGISFKAEPKMLTFKDGECEVWMRSIEYQSPKSQAHALNTMGILTHGLNVKLRQIGPGPSLVFEGDVIATGSSAEKFYLPGGVELVYEGWLFEGHGYFLWWWDN